MSAKVSQITEDSAVCSMEKLQKLRITDPFGWERTTGRR